MENHRKIMEYYQLKIHEKTSMKIYVFFQFVFCIFGQILLRGLRLKRHTEYIIIKIDECCGLIYCLRHICTKLLLFYISLAKTPFTHGMLVCGRGIEKFLTKVEAPHPVYNFLDLGGIQLQWRSQMLTN